MSRMDGRRIQGFLNVHTEIHVVEEELQRPLVLTIAAWRAKDHKRLTVSGNQRRSQRGAGAFARSQGVGALWIQVEHLPTCAKRKPQALDDRRGTNPAAARRRSNHVAFAVNGIEMGGIANVRMPQAQVADFTLCHIQGAAIVLRYVEGRVGRHATPNIAGAHLPRCFRADKIATPGGIFLREQHVKRRLVKQRIAVVGLAVGKGQFCALDQHVQVVR